MNTVIPVSVVIPCYRCAKTIERAVASVAAQTVQPMELILVDDASTDETRAILNKLFAKYRPGWIHVVVLERNAGAASARNAGWDRAQGDYVAFLDADDAWHSRKLELQYGFMSRRPDIVVSGHGHIALNDFPQQEKPVGKLGFDRVAPTYVLLKNPFVTPSFMVRRNLPFRFLAGRRYMEDHYFLMQLATAGLGIARTKEPLTYIFKRIFGDSGLSADLLDMQTGEIENYTLIGRSGFISPAATQLLKGYSWLKYFRRIVLVKFRKMSHYKNG